METSTITFNDREPIQIYTSIYIWEYTYGQRQKDKKEIERKEVEKERVRKRETKI